MQLGHMFKQEAYDEQKFCRYYLKLYMRLKELDRTKTQGIKFSKAFSEFTVLVYHNIFGPGNGPETLSPTKLQQQFDNSNSQKQQS